MPVYRFFWYPGNQEHVEEHGVSVDEFEAIVCDPLETQESHSSERMIAFGYGDDGRRLACVYDVIDDFEIIPVTAFEVK
jgi:uncharacterized DUF497 family protein